MVYQFVGLSTDSKEASAQLNDVMALSTPSMGQVELIFEENAQFPKLFKLLDQVSNGDVVLVYSISKFGASHADALNVLRSLIKKGVRVLSVKEGEIPNDLGESMRTAVVPMPKPRSKFSRLLR